MLREPAKDWLSRPFSAVHLPCAWPGLVILWLVPCAWSHHWISKTWWNPMPFLHIIHLLDNFGSTFFSIFTRYLTNCKKILTIGSFGLRSIGSTKCCLIKNIRTLSLISPSLILKYYEYCSGISLYLIHWRSSLPWWEAYVAEQTLITMEKMKQGQLWNIKCFMLMVSTQHIEHYMH